MGAEVIEIAGLRFRLWPTPDGLVPLVEKKSVIQPLTVLFDSVTHESLSDFIGAIESGREIEYQSVYVWPVAPDEDLQGAADIWRELTGNPLGDDLYGVQTRWGHPLYVPRAVLLEVAGAFVALRAGTITPSDLAPRDAESSDPPSPWLFRREAIRDEPHPDEESLMRIVESAAVEDDRLASLGGATGAAKRRFLRAHLSSYGLLEVAHGDARTTCLERWQLPLLLGFQRAALVLGEYARSSARARRLGDDTQEPSVSVDWFRLGVATPEGWDADDWLAFCERSFRDATIGDGYSGELYIHQGDFRCVVQWCRDDAVHPVVVSARLR